MGYWGKPLKWPLTEVITKPNRSESRGFAEGRRGFGLAFLRVLSAYSVSSAVRHIPLLALVLCSLASNGQVANIEGKRIEDDTSTWSGSAGIDFAITKNTQLIQNLGGKAHLQLHLGRSRFLLLGEISYLRTEGSNLTNSAFGHLRYNYKISPLLTWEAFTQTQYNQITKIQQRTLLGTGPRFRLVKSDKVRLYLGTLYMYEYEEVTGESINRDHRMSSYLAFSWYPKDNITLGSTTYYQPLLAGFSDYRIASDNYLELAITKSLSFRVAYLLNVDSNPPAGIPTTTYELRNGLKLEF